MNYALLNNFNPKSLSKTHSYRKIINFMQYVFILVCLIFVKKFDIFKIVDAVFILS